jgi:hypothetical protein
MNEQYSESQATLVKTAKESKPSVRVEEIESKHSPYYHVTHYDGANDPLVRSIVSRAKAAGRIAYRKRLRAGRPMDEAICAYNRAYLRTVPPCWLALLPPPSVNGFGSTASADPRGRERPVRMKPKREAAN